ncbi:MAG: hypothetical protein WA709_04225 [Stellaceae bacterium]
MPDLNQIKQGEQGRATGAGGSPKGISPAILTQSSSPGLTR